MNAGIHYPNARFRQMDRFYQFNWSGIVLLHYQRGDIPKLREHYPNARILVRGYLANWYTTDPLAWAQEIAGWANENRPYNIEITYANEQNLKCEGHPQGAGDGNGNYPPAKQILDAQGQVIGTSCQLYEDIARWNGAVLKELRSLIPWAVIHFPALSQGHSDDQNDAGYAGEDIIAEVVKGHDIRDVHTYWTNGLSGDKWYGQRYQLLHDRYPNMPLDVSECGNIQMNAAEVVPWLTALPHYIRGNAWFIWDSDEGNHGWALVDQTSMLDALATPIPDAPIQPPADIVQSPFGTTGYTITQRFGENPSLYKPYGFKGHEGVDLIPQSSDWSVHAVEDGEVIRDYDDPGTSGGYGIYVVVWNQAKRRGFWYCHLASNTVTLGQRVTAGQKLGMMGNTGNSHGFHLHLGLRYGDEYRHPIHTDNGYKGFVDSLPLLPKE